MKEKTRFFLFRILSYLAFFFLPFVIQADLSTLFVFKVLIATFYIFFMISQWYLLGKEIDHFFKIYFRVNSTMDRFIYRICLGMIVFVLIFNILSLFSEPWGHYCFYALFIFLGFFYSWPSRGKIVHESVTQSFLEFRFLDSFEKILLAFIFIIFLISVPTLPTFTDLSALKLYFDSSENFCSQFWNFLHMLYLPFRDDSELLKLGICLHFYIVGIGLFLFAFYAFLRMFVSRRLSLLGILTLISSWSFCKILETNLSFALSTTLSLLWIWAFLWAGKSATYKSGLFIGLLSYYMALLNPIMIIACIIQVTYLYFVQGLEQTKWYRKKQVRYALFGLILAFLSLFSRFEFSQYSPLYSKEMLVSLQNLFSQKGIFSISILGLIILFLKYAFPAKSVFATIYFNLDQLIRASFLFFILFILSGLLSSELLSHFTPLWPLAFLTVIPIEFLFQLTVRLRSQRNMIYLLYLILCLLDSHFEERVKIFIKFIQGVQ